MFKFLYILITFYFLSPANAEKIIFDFDLDEIPKCSSGKPNLLNNPKFTFSSLPKGAKWVFFKLRTKNLENFNHGGSWVELKGKTIINAGKFKYKIPCPFIGNNIFQWTAYFTEKKSSIYFYGQPLGVIYETFTSKNYP